MTFKKVPLTIKSNTIMEILRFTMGKEIDAGNLTAAENIRQGIGAQSCYACHVLHMPAQFEKAAGQ